MSYWSETIFTLIVTMILTFDLVTQIAKGVIYSPWPMHMWSIKQICQFVDELLIGNELVNRQTDRLTSSKTIYLFFFKDKQIRWIDIPAIILLDTKKVLDGWTTPTCIILLSIYIIIPSVNEICQSTSKIWLQTHKKRNFSIYKGP